MALSWEPIEFGAPFSTIDVTVTRSGSSDGAVGVRLDTFDRGGAIGGVHHPETSEWLRWDDGELGPMTLSIPILAQGETPLTFGVAVGSASWLRC